MKKLTILDKTFVLSIPAAHIQAAVTTIAQRMNADFPGQNPLFLIILNGSFIFAADLVKQITIPCEMTFLKVASYQGTTSTGTIKEVLGLDATLKDRVVIIVEDIVDTGHTLDYIIQQVQQHQPRSIKVATLLYKPDAVQKVVPLDYVGLEIPNDFIVGYGLDYNGYGRNSADIFVLA